MRAEDTLVTKKVQGAPEPSPEPAQVSVLIPHYVILPFHTETVLLVWFPVWTPQASV
jgi:hypothetical protein